MAVDPNIKNKAAQIRKADFGVEVRESLASGLESMSEDVVDVKGRQLTVEGQFQTVIEETTGKDVISAPEIIAARGNHSNLSQRLLSADQQLEQTDSNLNQRVDNLVIPSSPENANLEVTDSHVSSVKAKTFKSLNNRFEDTELDIIDIYDGNAIQMVNRVTNSLLNTTDGWVGTRLTASDGILSARPLSTYSEVTTTTFRSEVVPNNLYYQSVWVRVLDEECEKIELLSPHGLPVQDVVLNPENGKWYKLETDIFRTLTGATDILFNIRTTHAARGEHTIQYREPLVIDLTADLGEEIKLAQLKELLSKRKNQFFHGIQKFSVLNKRIEQLDSKIISLAEDTGMFKPKENENILYPKNSDNVKLISESKSASNWKFTSTDGTSVGEIIEVTEIDTSRFPETNLTDTFLSPWKYGRSSLFNLLGDKIIKCEMPAGGTGTFSFGINEPVTFNTQDGEFMVLIWVDLVSEGISGKLDISKYSNYPNLTERSTTLVGSTQYASPKGFWSTMLIPYIEVGSAFPRWAGLGGREPSNGVGFNVTESSEGFNFYIAGVFQVKSGLDKGILMIDFDDGVNTTLEVYNYAFPYMKSKGYNANIVMNGSFNHEEGRLGVKRMMEMEKNGWDMVSHGWHHEHFGRLSTFEEAWDQVKLNYDYLVDNGCARGARFFAPPNNTMTTDGAIAASTVHKVVRGEGTMTGMLPEGFRQHAVPSQEWSGLWTEAQWRDLLKTIQDKKVIRSIHAHGILTGWHPFNSLEQFYNFIDIIGEYDIEVMSYSQVWDDVLPKF